MTRLVPLILFLFAAACEPISTSRPAPQTPEEQQLSARAEIAARQFLQVVQTVEPVAERECRIRSTQTNCDFRIVVDDRPNQAPNAFQTEGPDGRPILAFNLALIASVQNADELAFVMGHEASHHIRGHLERTRQNATAGAVILSGIAAITGGTAADVQSAQELGAALGARTYSKDFELEADELGTIIAARAGYDPVLGAQFFGRIPDPGNRFLGTHPPNAERMALVRRTAAGL